MCVWIPFLNWVVQTLINNLETCIETKLSASSNRACTLMQASPQIPLPSGKVDTVSFSRLILSLSWHEEISGALLYKQDNTGRLCLHMFSKQAALLWQTLKSPNVSQGKTEFFVRFSPDLKPWGWFPLTLKSCFCIFWNTCHRKINLLGLGENSDPSRVPSKALGLSAFSGGMERIAGLAGLD